MATKKPAIRLSVPPARKSTPKPVSKLVSAKTAKAAVYARRRARSSTPLSNNIFFAAVTIGLLFGFLPTALVLVVGGMPTLVAVVVDRNPRHYLGRCVGFLNFAGVLPYLLKLWAHHTTIAAVAMLTDPFAWLVMYGAAAVGWIIYLSAPSIAWLQVELMGARRIQILKSRQHRLIEEWGEEVAGVNAISVER